MEGYVKAKKQESPTVVLTSKDLEVVARLKYMLDDKNNGELVLKSAKKTPDSLKELFRYWYGDYQRPKDLDGRESVEVIGENLW